MDLATILGVISSFALVFLAIAMGSNLKAFFDLPSAMIVLGGTMGATMINYPLADVIGVFRVGMKVLFARTLAAADLVATFVDYATRARREGIVTLDGELEELKDDFFRKGLQLTVDGLEPQAIDDILRTEIDYVEARHRLGAEIFTTMAAYSPALGMIGTLIGLVQMLQSMEDPSAIGPAMAVALITTFYGAILAYLLFLPMAGKLRKRSQEEVLVKELIMGGVLSLARGENPRVVEQRLLSFIPPDQRRPVFK